MHAMLYGKKQVRALYDSCSRSFDQTVMSYSQTLIDQCSGKPDTLNWLAKVLARYRLTKADDAYGGFDGQGTKFGVYLTPMNTGMVSTGDEIKVLRRKRLE